MPVMLQRIGPNINIVIRFNTNTDKVQVLTDAASQDELISVLESVTSHVEKNGLGNERTPPVSKSI